MVMPGLATERAADALGLTAVREVYADRTYDDSGNLTSRKTPGAVLHDPTAAADRVLRMVEEQAITTVSGKRLPARIETICVHGDTPSAVAMARIVRETLEANGVAVAPFRAP
jgi:5-oxoprolinase (ATP-hydrolysing) subunit A